MVARVRPWQADGGTGEMADPRVLGSYEVRFMVLIGAEDGRSMGVDGEVAMTARNSQADGESVIPEQNDNETHLGVAEDGDGKVIKLHVQLI